MWDEVTGSQNQIPRFPLFFFYNTSSEEEEKRPRGVSDQVENLMKIESRPSVVQQVVYPEEDVNLLRNQWKYVFSLLLFWKKEEGWKARGLNAPERRPCGAVGFSYPLFTGRCLRQTANINRIRLYGDARMKTELYVFQLAWRWPHVSAEANAEDEWFRLHRL